ncbi:MAG: outer membrane lipoprotein-sorting protein [Acidobacteria bacterium]|nr:outer membrane lipoprotein-sorting protein [Acidobacteriota bacterium]
MNDRHRSRCSGTSALACALGLALALPPGPFVAAAPAPVEAAAIVAEAQRRTESKSHRYEGVLRSFDAGGKATEKRWTYERLGSHGASKVVIRFTAPAEVKGVALLIANHPDRASDQWMWTPAIERDRRIALQDRSTRFFGTDFTFEDLEERDVDQFDYTLQADATIDGAACWTIQSTPKPGKRSQYARSILWIRQDDYAFARMEMWSGDAVVRRLDYGALRNVQGIWTAHELRMADVRRGTRTELRLDRVQYDVPLRDTDFTLEALRR